MRKCVSRGMSLHAWKRAVTVSLGACFFITFRCGKWVLSVTWACTCRRDTEFRLWKTRALTKHLKHNHFFPPPPRTAWLTSYGFRRNAQSALQAERQSQFSAGDFRYKQCCVPAFRKVFVILLYRSTKGEYFVKLKWFNALILQQLILLLLIL